MKSTHSFFFFSSVSNVVLLLVLLPFLASGGLKIATAIVLPTNVTFPAVFVFGDSLVDNGNNNALLTLVKCNFPPYGMDFKGSVPTGRFSNGKTPPDIIAEELGIKDTVPAYLDPNLQTKDLLTGVTFASGGSGWDPLTPLFALVYSMEDQLNHLKEYIEKVTEVVGEERACFILANSFFVIVVGSNDLTNTFYNVGLRRLQYDIQSYSQFLAESASKFVQELYDLGARRIGVFGVPPLGCLPSQRTTVGVFIRECLDEKNQASVIYNNAISNALTSLSATLDGSARIVYIDLYNPILDIIQSPQQYGFEVVDRGCCGTGLTEVTFTCNPLTSTCPDDTKYLFWDAYHPTERGYRIIIRQLLQKYISRLY